MKTITMPQAGQSMEEGTIVRWLKAEGDKVAKGEVLLEIETDKATVEVEATDAGTLRKILTPAGTTLPVHAPIAIVGTPKEKIDDAVKEAEAELAKIQSGSAPAAAPAPASSNGNGSAPKAAPAAVDPATLNVTPVLMPQAGQSMEEGTIVKWRVAPGAAIKKGDIIFEVETDKAVVEVEATDAGRLSRIVLPEGGTCAVKLPVAYLAENDANVDAYIAATGGAAAAPIAVGETVYAEIERLEKAAGEAGAPPAGVTPVLMPQAGQSMEEGTIVKWRVAPGATIKPGDIIFEVETDKAVVEVEATDAGKLAKIVVGEGEVCAVKLPVAYLAEDVAALEAWLAKGGTVAAPAPALAAAAPVAKAAPAAAPAAPARPATPAAVTAEGRVKASPAARKLAEARGVNLAAVGAGSGPGGRILSTDVAVAPVGAAAGQPALPRFEIPTGPIGEPVRRKMSGMRKAIARNLVASKQNVPHFYMKLTIDADPLFAFYRGEKAKYPVSVNDAIALACARVIHEFPAFKSRVDGDETIEFPTANIGIAVGMDDGLVVPVVMGVERLTLGQLASETKRVAEAAKRGKIENMGQGVFTISNLGMFGVEEFSAIINPPEAAILAVSAIREEVIVKNGAMRPGRVMTMVLSSDHRIIDGLLAAKFVARLKEVLENPAQLA